MESFNLHKSYTQLPNPPIKPLASDHQTPPRKSTIIAAAVAALLLLTLLLLLSLLAIAIFQSSFHDRDLDDIDHIRSLCSYTPHPSTCISTITSSLNTTRDSDISPHVLISLSMTGSIASLTNMSETLKRVVEVVDHDREKRTVMALRDCEELVEDAAGTVRKAAEVARGAKEEVKGDLETWVSAAMTDLETCVDGLAEVGAEAAVVETVKGMVEEVNVRLSNSLAIVANMERILKEFERD